MSPEDISRFVHGCDISNFKNEDYLGSLGIAVMHYYLSRGSIDPDRFSREFKLNNKDVYLVCERFSQNGFFLPYNWVCKSRGALLSILRHKDKDVVKDWCQIASVASGFTGKA